MLKFIKKNFKLILTTILSILFVVSLVGLVYFEKSYSKAPGEVWLLNGGNETMLVKNTLLVVSNDYEKQFITGGTLVIKDGSIMNNIKRLEVYLCYEYDDICVFNTRLESDELLDDVTEVTIGSRSTTAFEDGFIKDKDNNLFKTRRDFESKLKTMYFKLIMADINNDVFEYTVDIKPNHEFVKRINLYEIPIE